MIAPSDHQGCRPWRSCRSPARGRPLAVGRGRRVRVVGGQPPWKSRDPALYTLRLGRPIRAADPMPTGARHPVVPTVRPGTVNDWAVVEIGSDDSTSRPSLHQAVAVRSGRRVLGRRILAGAGSLDAPALRADTQPPTGPSRRRMNARTRLGSSRSCVLACHPPPVFGPTVTRRITTSIGIGGRPEHTNAFPTGDS